MKLLVEIVKDMLLFLSIPSTGRTGMKLNAHIAKELGEKLTFNTLNGSYRDEAKPQTMPDGAAFTFNTLNGSYRDEALVAGWETLPDDDLSIPSTGRTGMKPSSVSHSQGSHKSFNTLNGSYRDEAPLSAKHALNKALTFNTLNGSYRDEAGAAGSQAPQRKMTFNTLNGSYRDEADWFQRCKRPALCLSIPSTGRTGMKLFRAWC